MPISRLIEFVPPEVVYRRDPLPDEQNAWFPWKEAVAAVSLPESNEDGTDLISRLFWGDPESGEPVDIETDSEQACVAELLERNQRMLELVDEGIRRGRLWSPDSEFEAVQDDNVSLIESGDVIFRLEPQVRMLLALRTKLARAQRNLDSVADRLIDFLRIGKIICTSDSSSIDFILGVGFQMSGSRGIHRFVSQESLPRDILQKLLSGTLDQLVTNEDVIRCVCVDMAYDELNRIDQMPESADFDTVFDQVVRLHYYDDLSTAALFVAAECTEDSDSVIALQQQIDWRREKLRYLLEDHPCLYAKKETAALFGQQVLDWARQLRSFGDDSNGLCLGGEDNPQGICEIWPEQLQPGFPINFLGDSASAREHRRMVEDVIGAEAVEEWQWAIPPTDAELEAARRELRETDNPIGQLLVETTMAHLTSVISTNQLREHSLKAISLLRERLGQNCREF